MNISGIYFILFSIESSLSSLNSIPTNMDIYPNPSKLRVVTRHYEPYMYRTHGKNFENGIEYHLMNTIARKLNTTIEYVDGLFDSYNLSNG